MGVKCVDAAPEVVGAANGGRPWPKVDPDDRPIGAVKSADRVLTLLEYLAQVRHAPFAAIVRDLGLPNSSGHQLLQTVTARGFIEFDELTRTFRIGSRLWEVAQSYTVAADLAAIAQPLMDDLRDHTTETVQLARLDGLENVYLAISESPHPMKLVSAVGSRRAAHATGLGKVLLANLDPAELERRLDTAELTRYTERTITTRKALRAALAEIQKRGFAEDHEEFVVGCRCLAMPVHDADRTTVAAMSVSVPTPRFNETVTRRIRTALAAAVRDVEAKLDARGNATASHS